MTQGPPGRENAKFTRAFMVDGTTGSNCCFTSLVKGFYRPLREFSLWPLIEISELPGNREAVRPGETVRARSRIAMSVCRITKEQSMSIRSRSSRRPPNGWPFVGLKRLVRP